MSETTASGRTVPPSTQQSGFWATPRGRLILRWIVILIIAIIGYTLGRRTSTILVEDYKQTNAQYLSDNRKLNASNAQLIADMASLEKKMKELQEEVEKLTNASNNHRINTNESLTILEGRLTLGLIGIPSADRVALNINGKQHNLAAGSVVEVVLDPSTTCRIEVVSFAIKFATVNASCKAA